MLEEDVNGNMIKLSNGRKLEFLAASGALGFDGKGYWWEQPLRFAGLFDTSLFTPITKTLTYLPEQGNCKRFNPFSCIRFLNNGILNAMGLPNPGINEWIEENKNFKGIVSIYPNNNLRQTLKLLYSTNAKAIELNISCPNVRNESHTFDFEGYHTERIARITKENTHLPIILKLSVTHNINNLFPNIERYIDAISINSVPWEFMYPEKKSPLQHLGGGALSGKIVQPYTWKFIDQLIEITDVPVIGCSVWDYEDIDKLYEKGCKAISFGSIFLRYPWKPTVFVRRYKHEIQIREYNQSKR